MQDCWKETEKKLLEKVRHIEHSKVQALTKAKHEIAKLKEKLEQAEESISALQIELKNIQVLIHFICSFNFLSVGIADATNNEYDLHSMLSNVHMC